MRVPSVDAYQKMAISKVDTTSTKAKASTAASDTGSVPNQQVAKVTISSEARQLAENSAGGVMNANKVAKLKADAETNALQFDSTKIAERMIAALG